MNEEILKLEGLTNNIIYQLKNQKEYAIIYDKIKKDNLLEKNRKEKLKAKELLNLKMSQKVATFV